MFMKGKQSPFLITHTLCHSVKSDKNLDSDRRNTKSRQNRRHPLSFEIWIFRNSQPDRSDDHIIFAAITSTDLDIVYLCCPYDFMLYKNC